jgi:acyl-CoA reductase-like NAD-dependent aldehyde dehydrogenase
MNQVISNAETAQPLLLNFVDGRFVESKGAISKNRNPANRQVVSLVREADQVTVDEAVAVARRNICIKL